MHQAANSIIDNQYQVLTPISMGGFGVVHKARHVSTGKLVAVKIMHSDLASNDSILARFRREAEIISKLSHPALPAFYGSGFIGNCPYLAVEFVEAASLQSVLKEEKRLSYAVAVSVLDRIADVVGYAHGHAIVHRDLKPNNVLLGATGNGGVLKVIDFGLAKPLSGADVDQSKLTATGDSVGTPHYMSPEQCQGHAIDHRSDIYALGCLLYFCLVGAPPFDSPHQYVVMQQHVFEPPPSLPSTGMSAAQRRGADEVIAIAMSKNPADRFQSCEEFRAALAQLAALPEANSGWASALKQKFFPGRHKRD